MYKRQDLNPDNLNFETLSKLQSADLSSLPELSSSEAAGDLLLEAIQSAGFIPGKQVSLALDVASTEFYEEGIYKYEGKNLDSSQMISYLSGLVTNYPIVSIEDGLAEDDWDGWSSLNKEIGNKVQLVGDDLFVTNTKRLRTVSYTHLTLPTIYSV